MGVITWGMCFGWFDTGVTIWERCYKGHGMGRCYEWHNVGKIIGVTI